MLRICTILRCLLAAVFIASCESRFIEPDPVESGFVYYPLEVNSYWIYDVSSIRHTLIDGIDTSRFQVKEVIKDTFSDIAGNLNYRLELYTRASDQSVWPSMPDSVWTIRQNNSQLVRTESNIPYVVILSRVESMKSWNRNAWNSLEPQINYIVGLGKSLEINGRQFDNTVKVVQSGYMDEGGFVEVDSNRIFYKHSFDRFASDIGMVDQVKIDIKYAQKDGMPVYPPQVDAGSTEYYKILIDYGKE
jgi:hypothetical protein